MHAGTSTVEPVVWYSFLTAAVQMLLSFVYFTSILSMAIIPRRPSKVGPNNRKTEKCTFVDFFYYVLHVVIIMFSSSTAFTKYLRNCIQCGENHP